MLRIGDRYSRAIDEETADAEYDSAANDLDRRWNRRYERYATASAETVRDKAIELRITAPTCVEVVTDPDMVGFRPHHDHPGRRGPLAASLPASGNRRRAGRLPLLRSVARGGEPGAAQVTESSEE